MLNQNEAKTIYFETKDERDIFRDSEAMDGATDITLGMYELTSQAIEDSPCESFGIPRNISARRRF